MWWSWFNAKNSEHYWFSIISVKGNDYGIHFWYMSKYEAINLLRNADLTEKSETL